MGLVHGEHTLTSRRVSDLCFRPDLNVAGSGGPHNRISFATDNISYTTDTMTLKYSCMKFDQGGLEGTHVPRKKDSGNDCEESLESTRRLHPVHVRGSIDIADNVDVL